MTDTPLIHLAPGGDRRVKAGHPWAFSNEIAMTPALRALPPGTPARLEGDDGVKHGVWHFNPHSLIAARRLDANPAANIDAAWFQARLAACLALRERLFDTPFYRLVHAEADGLPGLIIDRYGDAVAIQANTAGMDAATPHLVAALNALFAPRLIVARNDSAVRKLEGLAESVTALQGEGTATVEDSGLRFPVDLLGGQKTGWFFDQRANRAMVARLCAGRSMLDAFCHTGGFGLAAAAAGAREVTLLDRSEHALDHAMQAARLAGLAERVTPLKAEALEHLEKMAASGRKFEVVVADPPAFAKTRKDQPAALRGYGKLARLAAGLVAPDGILFIASCSHHVSPGDFTDAVGWGVHKAKREARLLATVGAGPDHPVHPGLPESAYLKGLLLHLT
ncbi:MULTISPECIES: class I SAM-dependent rRNA methyltransferase [Roseomonadaceae]|uniref:Class I SAM-dependent rRNA methyltransferase n=1 Tax=Falsiroseomonas oleicola TaxID=2801474 RepID=A0ABS6HD90_9PROT|nr:class I SAM-dependent rRNA methyltransferase [Roseomonas oleicola]MBU8545441.1 class I SAM-dependent rRNA methyltransferase [Roseomonas oleicola]